MVITRSAAVQMPNPRTRGTNMMHVSFRTESATSPDRKMNYIDVVLNLPRVTNAVSISIYSICSRTSEVITDRNFRRSSHVATFRNKQSTTRQQTNALILRKQQTCTAESTGFLNICIDFTFLETFNAGISTNCCREKQSQNESQRCKSCKT
jgi:hypothetical protein